MRLLYLVGAVDHTDPNFDLLQEGIVNNPNGCGDPNCPSCGKKKEPVPFPEELKISLEAEAHKEVRLALHMHDGSLKELYVYNTDPPTNLDGVFGYEFLSTVLVTVDGKTTTTKTKSGTTYLKASFPKVVDGVCFVYIPTTDGKRMMARFDLETDKVLQVWPQEEVKATPERSSVRFVAINLAQLFGSPFGGFGFNPHDLDDDDDVEEVHVDFDDPDEDLELDGEPVGTGSSQEQ